VSCSVQYIALIWVFFNKDEDKITDLFMTCTDGIKRSRREVDHSPPSNAEVKNAWTYTSFSLHRRSGAHPAFYPMRTRGSFPRGKKAEA
jgi:hypothetical protein